MHLSHLRQNAEEHQLPEPAHRHHAWQQDTQVQHVPCGQQKFEQHLHQPDPPGSTQEEGARQDLHLRPVRLLNQDQQAVQHPRPQRAHAQRGEAVQLRVLQQGLL